MVELQKNLAAFEKRGVRVLAASVDSVAQARAMAERTGAAYTLVSDVHGRLLDLLQTWHRDTPKGDIAIASSFLFDRTGKLLWYNITDDYKVRPKPAEIFRVIDARKFNSPE